MGGLERILGSSAARAPDESSATLVLALLLAFALSQAIAWLYTWTHSGLSYARSFTQSLILMSLVVSLVMFVIGSNIATAFGLFGALAIIRFRNVLKDTRDTVYVFFTLVIGIATGTQRFETAIIGTIAFTLVVLYLHATSFGTLGRYDGHLSLRVLAAADFEPIEHQIRRFCRRVKRVSLRQSGSEELVEYLFQVRLRNPDSREGLLDTLRQDGAVDDVSLVLRDVLSEV